MPAAPRGTERPEPPETPEIIVLNPNRYPEAAVRRLRPWLTRMAAAVLALPAAAPGGAGRVGGGGEASLGVRFAGDRELRRANRLFRGQDRVTDVLSFAGYATRAERTAPHEGSAAGEAHLGDILISVPAARRQARAAGHSTAMEIRILLLHGLLHCRGYDHETDRGEMARLERRLRGRWVGPDADSADSAAIGSERAGPCAHVPMRPRADGAPMMRQEPQ
ncbi:MAG TPA: rRNA maturation RNase YbeY [Thermoanaerobaculia bacterium]|nr:rRNA maturation RNase YbeY [Thermoanaerobaculia bacterium]